MARLQGLMVIDKRLTQLHRVYYDMEDSYIGLELGVEVHRIAAVVACSRARDVDFAPLHIGFRLISATMSHQRGTPR